MNIKSVRSFFITNLLGSLVMLSACSKGELAQESQIFPFQISSKEVLDYTNEIVKVRLKGEIVEGSISDDERLQFFTSSSCGGDSVGNALVSEFKSSGVVADLPINVESEIFISSTTSSECIFVDKYKNPALTPGAPLFNRTEPVSPSREVTSPGLFGTAFPPSGTVEFYSDAACATMVSNGSVTAFSSAGLIVPLPINTITVLHALTKDAFGQQSACTELVTYEHNNSFNSPPRMTYISVSSPSNQSFTPTLRGSTDLSAVGVALYSDSGCTVELASGTPDDFLNIGFQINSSANSSITIYGRSVDDQDMPSTCARLTTFVHDDVDPAVPIFVSISPTSPTNATTVPALRGTTSADTETVTLYSSNTCLSAIGSGIKAQFESTGVTGGVGVNTTTDIYARAFDEAGNDSSCVLMTTFVHNNIPPSAPLFINSDPPSPTNGTLTPLIRGNAADRTVLLNFYKNALCTGPPAGSGNRAQYEGGGITVNVDPNTNTSIYVSVSDIEGNNSECTFHAPYDHSNAPASSPGFFRTFPDSPTRASNNPAVLGTAGSLISTVVVYNDNTCTTALGSGTRGQFISSGINITVPFNSTTDLHAQSTDIYGNLSPCALLTTFVHNTVLPTAPTYSAVAPLSPNNSSFTPTITGTALINPASELPPIEVSFYDSPACVSRIGIGTPAEFSGSGITLNVAQNAETFVYARVFDAAGNRTACTYMTTYIHNARQPGVPIFGATMPASPSYTVDTSITGSFGISNDFMDRVSVIIYSDATCMTEVTNGSPTDFEGTGIPIVANENTTNPWYAVSVNEVGTSSNCTMLTNFVHHDAPISTLSASLNTNGSVFLNWTPDLAASPLPTYSVERAVNSGGPYTVVSSGQPSNSYTDSLISDNTDYFYRVFGSNLTGRGQNSPEASISIVSPPSVQPVSLNATARDSQITLTWSGFPQNMTYTIARSLNYGGPFIDLGFETTTSSYTDPATANGQTFYYVVTASNPSGLSMRSNIASAVPRQVPAGATELVIIPRNSLAGCGGGRGLRMSWTASSYNTGYRINQTQTKGDTSNTATTSNTFLDLCGPSGGSNSYFSVDSRWGVNTSTVSSNSMGFFGQNAPSFTVFPGDGENVLDWTSISTPSSPVDLTPFAMQYDLYRSDDRSGEYTLYQPGLFSSDYIDTVANGTTYFYYVQPYLIDGDGDKLFMSYPTQIQNGTPALNPTAPTNLSSVLITEENRLQLQWVPPTHYNGFLLYRATSPGGPFTQDQFVNGAVVPSAPIAIGMNYFKVTSTWGSFESADSNVISFRNAQISGFNSTSSASSISLTWNSVGGVQDYVIFRSTELEGTYSSIGTSLTNNYEDTTASAAVGYYYKVKARFADFTEGQLSNYTSNMRTGSDTPSNVSLRQVGPSGVQVVWPRVSGAVNYIIRSSDTFGGTYATRGSTSSNTFNILGLLPDTEIFVTVTAVVGMTPNVSTPVSIITYGTPNAPSGEVGDSQVALSWSAVTSVLSYDILRTSDGLTFTTLSASYPTTNFTDVTAVNGNVYLYKIVLNFPGGATRTTGLSQPLSPGQTPLTPDGLTAENNGSGLGVVLSWGEVSGTTRYNIYRSTSSGSYGAAIQTSNSPNGTTVTGLTSGTTYYFRVSARNGSQESGFSNETSIVAGISPAAPTAEFSTSTSIDLSWLAVAGASTYNLERSLDGMVFETLVGGLGVTSYNDASIDPNKTYYYRFKPYSASGSELAVSNISQPVNVSVEPIVTLGFQANASSTSAVNLSWVSTPNIFTYEILRGTSAGGPYTLVGSPSPSSESFTDSTVTPGNTYYYVIRSLTQSKVPSPNSVEKAVNLTAPPAGLSAINNVSTVDLNWSSVAGALTYNVRRSRVASGPYAVISNTALLTYSDTDLVADFDYYYVVEAVFAGGVVSPYSNEASVNRDGFVNLQVVVELTDTAIYSVAASANTMERTRTSFDTDYYDGVASYELEIVAFNNDSSARSVSLIDESGSSVGAVVVPSGLTAPTRIKVAITPNPGADEYRLSLGQTTSNFDLLVYSAKLLVNQIGASKTRLYFPLLSAEVSPSEFDTETSVFETALEVYGNNPNILPFQRRVASLDKIVDYNAWALEAVVSSTGTAQGKFVFHNLNSALNVSGTETRFGSFSPVLATVPIDDGVNGFSNGDEGSLYSLNIRCEYNCSTGVVKVHKAGIWVELENLAKARVVNRIHSNKGLQSGVANLTDDRILYDATRYSSPKLYFQTYVEDDGTSSGSIELITSGTDSGALGLNPVPGSSLFIDNDGPQLITSPQITVPSGQRVMTRSTAVTGEITTRGSVLIIDVE
jgi:fibronectin type 3 domain-containing protein